LIFLESTIAELPQDAIVKLKIHGRMSQEAMAVLRAASLRAIAPPTMNIDTAFKDYNFF
jgi:predicted Fe-Mo cluster-binding NifX family protein